MVVQMGADGTEDKVSVKICSDANDLCCENVMKKTPNEDWKAGKKQEWLAADFGDCKNLKFKVRNIPDPISGPKIRKTRMLRPIKLKQYFYIYQGKENSN